MNFHDVDKSLLQRFDGVRIAWPSFRFAEQAQAAAARGKTVTCLTRGEILDLFADEFVRHPLPPGHHAKRPTGA
jgi:hypothetical protein